MNPSQTWVERRETRCVWLVDRDFEEPLAALGWPARETVAAALAGDGSRGRSTTAILALPGRPERLHLRPVRHGGLLGPLWRGTVWGTARPRAELEVTERLARAGAAVPRAVLMVGFRHFGPLWTAVFGTVHEEDALDGVAFLDARPETHRLRRAARAAGRAIRGFHDAGGSHADLHLKNLLVREREDTTRVLVLDLDGASADAPPDAARRMHELMRLYRSLVKRRRIDAVGTRGCATALSAYCDGDRALRREMMARLPAELRRVARHARGYG